MIAELQLLLLYLAPAALLTLALVHRWYPGERVIERLARRRRRRRRPLALASPFPVRPEVGAGRVLICARGPRGPPLVAVT